MRLRQLPDCLIFGTNQHFVILQMEFANSPTRHIYGCFLRAAQQSPVLLRFKTDFINTRNI